MTNDELEAIRHLPGSENAQAFVSVVQLWKLLDYVDELHGVIHDLRQEPGYELGRQEERHRAQQLIREAATHCATTDSADIIGQLAQDIEALGPVAPHLAPDDLRRENEALRR